MYIWSINNNKKQNKMRIELIKFLLNKKKQGKPMLVGQAMSKLNMVVSNKSSMAGQVNIFRQHWENNNN